MRTALVLAAASGLCSSAMAQEVCQVSLAWTEVVAGSTVPVGAPNGVLEPGEGARISMSVYVIRNGTNAVGQTTTYSTPPGPGTGVIVGLGGFIYSLLGDAPYGTWTNRAFAPYVNAANNWGGLSHGVINSNGTGIDTICANQVLAPGTTANSLNPHQAIYSAVWVPASYEGYTVTFRTQTGWAGPYGSEHTEIIKYGTALLDPTDPSTAYDLYVHKYLGEQFGSVGIPIVPAPWAGLILCSGLFRRRRPVP